MDLVTVVCGRDVDDMLLQAHSIDTFITQPTRHWVMIEDDTLSADEWFDLLRPYYSKHKLFLSRNIDTNPKEFYSPFTFGWRRQQILKIWAASLGKSQRSLILDAKNIFVRPIALTDWPVKHGNGRRKYRDTFVKGNPPDVWHNYVSEKLGIPVPEILPPTTATPFVMDRSIAREMINLDEMFFNEHIVPSEFQLYYFFLDPKQLDPETNMICSAIGRLDDYSVQAIRDSIKFCIDVFSPTHGLHREIRMKISQVAKDEYRNWLTSVGLDVMLVNNYLLSCSSTVEQPTDNR